MNVKLNPSYYLKIFLSLSFTLTLGLWVMSFLVKNIDQRKNVISNIKAEIEREQKKKEDFMQLITIYPNINNDLNKVYQFLPSTLDSSKIILDVQKIVQNNDCTLERISFSPPQSLQETGEEKKTKSPITQIPFEIAVSGSFSNVSRVLSSLEELSKINKVNNLDIKYLGNPTLKVTISGNFFIKKL